ncbi:FAD dependent oxidoreductase [Lactarius hatsudake]|nr:FAD dependent oxidoreductase [Lactarius hatsudake]
MAQSCHRCVVTNRNSLAYGYPGKLDDRATLGATSHFKATCHRIAATISNVSEVFLPPPPQYAVDISHTYASSSEASACSVEPGSADDVSKILRIIGSTRTPFAVKGGGHTGNPGFSSTRGVQISMIRFNNVTVGSGTVELGPGLTWDQVYAALDPTGVNVIGGRVPGVGVAGLTLGGGFSYKSNEYDLSVDNVVSYDLVLPNGTIASVTPNIANNTDLWFGLRGGMNNFVRKFVVKSYPQSNVWTSCFMFYVPDQWQSDAVKNALVRYQQKKDVKASAAVALNYYASGQWLTLGSFLFYDARIPPQRLFDDFLAIPTTLKNVSTRSFTDLVLSLNQLAFGSGSNIRNYFSGVPVTQYSPAIFDAFLNQTEFWGAYLASLDKNASVIVTLEPFDSGVFSHGSVSAFPPDRSQAIFPSVTGASWTNASIDGIVASALREEKATIHTIALAEGQNVSHAAVYVNYALFDTPLEDIYGQNVPRLRRIRAAIDPGDVMGLAGGFKF